MSFRLTGVSSTIRIGSPDHRERGAPGGDLVVHALPQHDAEEVAGRIDDREPFPPVAQEVLLLGFEQGEPGGDRHRLAVHHVSDGEVLDAPADRAFWRQGGQDPPGL